VVQFEATRRTLPALDMAGRFPEMDSFPSGTCTQVLHGCRQLVS
jgi:hypothetical protein